MEVQPQKSDLCQQDATKRKPYQTPRLTPFGSLAQITRGNGSDSNDVAFTFQNDNPSQP